MSTEDQFLESISRLIKEYEDSNSNQFTVGCEITIEGVSYVYHNNCMEEMELER